MLTAIIVSMVHIQYMVSSQAPRLDKVACMLAHAHGSYLDWRSFRVPWPGIPREGRRWYREDRGAASVAKAASDPEPGDRTDYGDSP
jgi:hypothetical protein